MIAFIGNLPRDDEQGAIEVCEVDETEGALSPCAVARQPRPSFLAFSENRRILVAASHVDQIDGQAGGSVSSYLIGPSAEISPLSRVRTPLTHPAFLTFDRTESAVLVACTLGGGILAIPLSDDGRLQQPSSIVSQPGEPVVPFGQHWSREAVNRQGACLPHCIKLSPSGDLAVVPDTFRDEIWFYHYDPKRRMLLSIPELTITCPAGTGPRHAVFNSRGDRLFVLNEVSSSVTVVGMTLNGRAAPHVLTTLATLPSHFVGPNRAADVVRSPDDKFLYCSNRGLDAITIFRILLEPPDLELVGFQPTTGREPRGIGLSPRGRFVYSANQESDSVTRFLRDPETGTLQPRGAPFSTAAPTCVVVADA